MVISRVLPAVDADGSAAYLASVIDHLVVTGWEVEVVWLPARQLPVRRRPRTLGSTRVVGPGVLDRRGWVGRPLALAAWVEVGRRRVGRVRRWGPRARSPGPRTPAGRVSELETEPTPAELAWLGRHLDRHPARLVVANYAAMAPALGVPAARRAASLILTHDVWHARIASLAHRGRRPWRPHGDVLDWERRMLSMAQGLVAIQWDDARVLESLVPDRPVEVVPMAVAVDEGPLPPPVPDRCLYVGSGAPHNVDGLRWFLSEVWPGVLARRPSATLEIVGRAGERVGPLPPGVRAVGHVPDVSRVHRGASVAVVPYLAGSGLKIKLVHALASGVATVATPEGVSGVADRLAGAVVVTADPDVMAAEVARLCGDPGASARLGRAGRDVARALFSPEAAREALTGLLERIGLPAGHTPPREV